MIKNHELSLCQGKSDLTTVECRLLPFAKNRMEILSWKATCTRTANNLLKEATSGMLLTAKVKSLTKLELYRLLPGSG